MSAFHNLISKEFPPSQPKRGPKRRESWCTALPSFPAFTGRMMGGLPAESESSDTNADLSVCHRPFPPGPFSWPAAFVFFCRSKGPLLLPPVVPLELPLELLPIPKMVPLPDEVCCGVGFASPLPFQPTVLKSSKVAVWDEEAIWFETSAPRARRTMRVGPRPEQADQNAVRRTAASRPWSDAVYRGTSPFWCWPPRARTSRRT